MIAAIDHIVLTTARLDECIAFYCDALGMTLERFVGGTPAVERLALRFGRQKINIHVQGKEFEPKAQLPTPGALDLCLIAALPLAEVIQQLQARQIAIVEGPVLRTGATGKINSVYVRDPDHNLIEISEYLS
ncbi:VOC family protein [Aquitalea magnusonii]|uniref:Catechol 2,3-dioxygenase-like lactoylglutathione lyase family enzyme n=1 Tax=Aquitalea magnusonii TaxID=332411 RepID=A0A318JNS1_9NEIS|nr:VOC family protein [Aquitalea magnusonii]PXX49524.1 catechol 2,3-dioxygenase-like lactoylglutathione lyase family enzyme [Aquitalea magnusonii]